MPIYEYQCERCAAVTDIKHGFKEAMTEVCPACGGTLKRLFNPASIVFKGSGFYVTDSRKSTASSADKPAAAKSETNAGGEPAAKGETAAKSEAPKSDASAASTSGKSDAAA